MTSSKDVGYCKSQSNSQLDYGLLRTLWVWTILIGYSQLATLSMKTA